MKVKNLEKLIRILQGIVCVITVLYSLVLILIKDISFEIKYFLIIQIIWGVLLVIVLESFLNTRNSTTKKSTIENNLRKSVFEFNRWLKEKGLKIINKEDLAILLVKGQKRNSFDFSFETLCQIVEIEKTNTQLRKEAKVLFVEIWENYRRMLSVLEENRKAEIEKRLSKVIKTKNF